MSADFRVGDVGTQFVITIENDSGIVDLSSATTLQIIFHKPDATLVTKTATLYTDGTDGKIYYIAISNDLDISGWWGIQGYIAVGSNHWHTDKKKFRVFDNYL
jgi:hypothetical protein